MISKQQGVTNGGGMTPHSDRRANCAMRDLVSVAQRHKNTLGPYHAARFLCANSVPIKVALRVIAGRTTA